MRRTGLLLGGLGVLALIAAQAMAQREGGGAREGGVNEPRKERALGAQGAPQAREARDGRERREGRETQGMGGDIEAMVKELNLTEDQQTKIRDKRQAAQTTMAEWQKQNAEKLQKMEADMRAARESNDPEARKRAQEQANAVHQEQASLEAANRKEIMSVLTPEQQAQWEGFLLYNREYAPLAKQIGLSDEEQAKLKEKTKALAAALGAWEKENGEKAATLRKMLEEAQQSLRPLQEAREKIMTEGRAGIMSALTPEQRIKWVAAGLQQHVSQFRQIQLTDEQMAKVKALCEEAAKETVQLPQSDIRGGGGPVVEKLRRTIMEQVLTDDQRKQLMERKPEGGREQPKAEAPKPAPAPAPKAEESKPAPAAPAAAPKAEEPKK